MRGATECARRLKKLFASLQSRLGKVSRPQIGDPVTQLLLGILSRDLPETKAREALNRMREMVVDYNELRVVAPIELAESLAGLPDVRLKCEDLSRALNAVSALEHMVSLDRLREMPKKEVRAYLEQIDGLEAYSRARIRLLGLQQHAIPLDEAMWAYARARGIVNARCPLVEAQQFLERQIGEQDALEFVALLRKEAWNEMGAAVRKGEVRRIRSVPPDRSSRNMLQLVAPGSFDEPAAPGPPPAGAVVVAKPAPAAQSDTPRKAKPAKAARRTRSAKARAKPKARTKAKRRRAATRATRKTKSRATIRRAAKSTRKSSRKAKSA